MQEHQSTWNIPDTEQVRPSPRSLRRLLYWTVLTSMWFSMVSTCTRVTLALDGASNPADQYHGWYRFFVTFSTLSLVTTALVVASALFILWLIRRWGQTKRGSVRFCRVEETRHE